MLADHGAALCIHDLFDARAFHDPFPLTTDWTYLRFHGPDAAAHPYEGRYTGRRLRLVADRLVALLASGVDVYAYFNNDDSGHAFRDASWLRDRLDGHGTDWDGSGLSEGTATKVGGRPAG